LRRRNSAYLASIERKILGWVARRLPVAIKPDLLTAAGVLGAVTTMLGYALAPWHSAMLWLASAGLAINWFGDSLDGTLARLRGIERPRYGFFLDNTVDLVSQALVAVGLGLSGYIRWEFAMAGLAAFFMVSMLALVSAQCSRVFEIAYFGLGLTEIRCVLVILNTLIFLFPPGPFELFGQTVTYPNLLAVAWIGGNLLVFFAVARTQLRQLATEDPPRRSQSSPKAGRQARR
jgi:phosphatidylglycerophosphate synthase